MAEQNQTGEAARHILTEAYTDDEWIEPRASFALITLTPAQATDLLTKIGLARRLKDEDSGFYALDYFFYVSDFLEGSEELDELWETQEGSGPRLLPAGFDATTILKPSDTLGFDDAPLRVEYNSALVSPEGVIFQAYIKHSSARVSTPEVEPAVLEEIAGSRPEAPAAPLVLVECDGGVPTWSAAGGAVEVFVLDWDVLDAGTEHDEPPAHFRAVSEWRETFEEFDRKRADAQEGEGD